MKSNLAALLPVVLLFGAFLVFCLIDVFKVRDVRYLPRWAWAIICVASVPLGGIIYLLIGRAP